MGEVAWTNVAPADFKVITPFTQAEDEQFTDLDNYGIQITSEKLDGVVVEGQPHELVEFLGRMITAVLEAQIEAHALRVRGYSG